jgi:hypothetical protein
MSLSWRILSHSLQREDPYNGGIKGSSTILPLGMKIARKE